jgi:hypothetical protein
MAHLPTNSQTVEAVDVRSKKTVKLVLTNQTFSNGVFSNIYRGKLVQPQEREVAIKKIRPDPGMSDLENGILAKLLGWHNMVQLLYVFDKKSIDGRIRRPVRSSRATRSLAGVPEHGVRVHGVDAVRRDAQLLLDLLDVELHTW